MSMEPSRGWRGCAQMIAHRLFSNAPLSQLAIGLRISYRNDDRRRILHNLDANHSLSPNAPRAKPPN